MSEWKINDLFTGEEKSLPKYLTDGSEPTQEWVQGWTDGMELCSRENPYTEFTLEWHEWNDGYEAARRD